MLREARVVRTVYDSKADVLRLVCEHAQGAVTSRRERVSGQLLLDANGFLVGVDLGGEGLERAVAMTGPHEAVARVEPCTVDVVRDAKGGADLIEVVVPEARARARGNDANPYV